MDDILDEMNKNEYIKVVAIDENNSIVGIERAMESSLTSKGKLVEAVIYKDNAYDLDDSNDIFNLASLSISENSELLKNLFGGGLSGGESEEEITRLMLKLLREDKFIDNIMKKSIKETIVLTRLYSEKSVMEGIRG